MFDIEAATKKIESLGDIHLLVNNAGIAILGPFEEIKFEDFDKYEFLFYYLWALLRGVTYQDLFFPRGHGN